MSIDEGEEDQGVVHEKKLRSKEHKIDMVLVSPFIRCIQTAAEVVFALYAVDEASLLKETRANVVLDPSKVKALVGKEIEKGDRESDIQHLSSTECLHSESQDP